MEHAVRTKADDGIGEVMKWRHMDLFSGYLGFSEGLRRAFGESYELVVTCEIERNCRHIIRRHRPGVQIVQDIKEFDGRPYRDTIDILTAGSPCQDLSVAGKQAGLSGDRSGLFFEAIRIIKEVEPSWVVFENVPGLLSSNNGEDFRIVLDSFEALGYIVDVDILDLQYFGVPQRRRRVFIVCEHVNHLLKSKTTSSSQTICQCLTEILHSIFLEHSDQSNIMPKDSGSLKSLSKDGRLRRMKLFGIQAKELWPTLLENLAAEQAMFPEEHELLGLLPGVNGLDTNPMQMGTWLENIYGSTGTLYEKWNTPLSWKNILEGILKSQNESTILIQSRPTIQSKIFFCAKALLNISAFIALSNSSYPTFWQAGLSALTALKACTNYARQAANYLFTPSQWVRAWVDFFMQAEPVINSLGNIRVTSFDQILPLSESLCWNSTPGREKGQGVTQSLTRSLGSGGADDNRAQGGFYVPEIVGTLAANCGPGSHDAGNFHCNQGVDAGHIVACRNSGQGFWSEDENSSTLGSGPRSMHEGTLIAHTLKSEGFDASEDGTGRGTPIIPILEAGARTGKSTDDPRAGIGIGKDGDPMFLLQSGKQHAIAFQSKASCTQSMNPSEVCPTMDKSKGDGLAVVSLTPGDRGISVDQAAAGMIQPAGLWVRRLVPRECERLMNLPDDWTAWGIDENGKRVGLSDSARYRMIGNGVGLPSVTWIGERIKQVRTKG